ncbi:hypothetical protein NDU88_007159 [Pleurodeles waltl]|uniref:Cyclin N-terminal domain-containing protein n=1 Tax=Pleurodeles waltl TaxID=8319 RepID=A0AAV7PNH3_PLEWA|nr:hypothetical protein NDU88_007159 [Pleurodeles waltl]
MRSKAGSSVGCCTPGDTLIFSEGAAPSAWLEAGALLVACMLLKLLDDSEGSDRMYERQLLRYPPRGFKVLRHILIDWLVVVSQLRPTGNCIRYVFASDGTLAAPSCDVLLLMVGSSFSVLNDAS